MKIYLFSFFVFVTAYSAKGQTALNEDRLAIAVYGDYLQDNLRWSIAGNSNGQNPNVLSEVQWQNLKLRGTGLDVEVNIWSGILFKGQYHRGTIYSGNAIDTDYSEDNRLNPSYEASLNSDQGHIYNFITVLSYRFKVFPVFFLAPYAGYSKSRQSLFLKNFNDKTPAEEKRLNSTYQTNWTGPVIGFDAALALKKRLSLKASLSYAQAKYRATADWNLIDAFAHPDSFRHTADGYEASAMLQLDFHIISPLFVFIRCNYLHAATGAGTDELFLIDGSSVISQFNEAVRSSKGAGIGICYHF